MYLVKVEWMCECLKNIIFVRTWNGWDWNTDTTDIRTQTDTLVSLMCPYFSHWYCVESNGVRNSDRLKYGHNSEGLKYGHISEESFVEDFLRIFWSWESLTVSNRFPFQHYRWWFRFTCQILPLSVFQTISNVSVVQLQNMF